MGVAPDGDDPIERLLDLFVYAPIGLLATGGEHLDEFIRTGREKAAVARTVGRFALQGVDDRVARSVGDVEVMAREFLSIVLANTSPAARRRTTDADAPVADTTDTTDAPSDAGDGAADGSPATVPGGVDDLVPGYDDLTAREILPLLDGLDVDALDRIEAHERAGRDRSTVLARLRRVRG